MAFGRSLGRPATIADLTVANVKKFREHRIASGKSSCNANSLRTKLRVLWKFAHTRGLAENFKPGKFAGNPDGTPKYRKRSIGAKHQYAFVMINGQEHYLGKCDSPESWARYRQLVAEWEASGRSPMFGLARKGYTIAVLAAAYLRHCRSYYGEGVNSETIRVARVIRTLCDLYGAVMPDEFGPQQFKAVRFQLLSADLSRGVINAMMKRVVRLFRWAVSEDLLPSSIAESLAMVPSLKRGRSAARETVPIGPVDESTVDATLPHLSQVVADMVRIQLLTGCRPAEICNLRPCDIDCTGEVWIYRPPGHKTAYLGKERAIAIGPQAQQVLAPYLSRNSQSRCFSPRESVRWLLQQRRISFKASRKTPIYPSEIRAREARRQTRINSPGRKLSDSYDPRSYRHAIMYACKKAGVTSWAPNRLRHTAATRIRRQFGLEAAQVALGHSQANVTQIYAERDLALATSVAKQIG